MQLCRPDPIATLRIELHHLPVVGREHVEAGAGTEDELCKRERDLVLHGAGRRVEPDDPALGLGDPHRPVTGGDAPDLGRVPTGRDIGRERDPGRRRERRVDPDDRPTPEEADPDSSGANRQPTTLPSDGDPPLDGEPLRVDLDHRSPFDDGPDRTLALDDVVDVAAQRDRLGQGMGRRVEHPDRAGLDLRGERRGRGRAPAEQDPRCDGGKHGDGDDGRQPPAAVRVPPKPAAERIAPLHGDDLDDPDRLLDALQPLDPAVQIANPVDVACKVRHRLARDHLPRLGERAQASGHVERAAAIARAHRNRLAGVEPDAHTTCETLVLHSLLDRECRAQGSARRLEHDERLVAAELDQPALMLSDRSPDELGERRSEVGGGLIAVLLGESGVPAHVADQEGADGRRPGGRRRDLASSDGRLRLGDQLAARAVALVGALRERLGDHAVERLRKLGPQRRDGGRRLAQVSKDDGEVVVARVRSSPREAFEEDASERVDIGAAVDLAPLDLLGGDVAHRAGEPAVAAQAVDGGRMLCEAEVGKPGAVVLDQHVGRLDVAVDQAGAMGGVQRIADLAEERERLGRLEPARGLDRLAQVATHVPHGEKQRALRLAGGVDGDDAGVLKAGGDSRLAQEPLTKPRVARQVGCEQLERHVPVEGVVAREVDRPGRAAAERPLDAVTGQHCPLGDVDPQLGHPLS